MTSPRFPVDDDGRPVMADPYPMRERQWVLHECRFADSPRGRTYWYEDQGVNAGHGSIVAVPPNPYASEGKTAQVVRTVYLWGDDYLPVPAELIRPVLRVLLVWEYELHGWTPELRPGQAAGYRER
jgi:hypothetical protein